LPKEKPPFAVTGKWETGAKVNTRNLVIEWKPEGPASSPDFYPFEAETFTVGTGTVVENKGEKVRIKKEVTLGDEVKEWPQALAGLVIDDSSAKSPIAYEARIELPAGPSAAAGTSDAAGVTFGDSPAPSSLWAVLGIAFLGGLILNIMPCVLPVIALKILSFVNQSGASPKRARQLGLIYALGVLTSFAVLAGLIIAVQRTGQIASWGMQYQSPVFLVVMITLVTLISLNLFGVFEITLGGKAMGAASGLASREGSGGAFFNGVLATVLGTSCTAPFLAFAIGYALGQPAWVILLVFLMMGVGLAFPYVVLTWNPALLRLLPKPGAWMEKFKVGMGFPMLATAVWLYSVAVKAHFGASGAFWLAMFLLLVAFAVWVFGAFIQRGAKRKTIAALASIGALVLAVAFVLEKQLNWRSPNYARNIATSTESRAGVDWQKWSPELVAKVRAERRPILVDFTADWCPNCQVNKYSSIEIEPVEKKLKEINAVAMIGDFTLKDPVIAEELKRFKRYAVPLVLVYPADPEKPPMILPEILTPQIVLDALDKAKGQESTSREEDKGLAAATR
jgi:thiol:disulfide interchange protein DsbD